MPAKTPDFGEEAGEDHRDMVAKERESSFRSSAPGAGEDTARAVAA